MAGCVVGLSDYWLAGLLAAKTAGLAGLRAGKTASWVDYWLAGLLLPRIPPGMTADWQVSWMERMQDSRMLDGRSNFGLLVYW